MANAEFFSFGDEELEAADAQRADELSGPGADASAPELGAEKDGESRTRTSPPRSWPLRWIVATALGAGLAAIFGFVFLVAGGDQDATEAAPFPAPVEEPAVRLEDPSEQGRLQASRDRASEHRRALRSRAHARRKAMRRRARRRGQNRSAAERQRHRAVAPTSEALPPVAEPLEALPPVAEPPAAEPPAAADEKPRGDALRDGSTSPEFGL